MTATFTPTPATGYTTLTLTASGSAPLGSSTVTITGASGALKKTTTFSLGVYVPTFALASNGPVILGQGSTASTGITVAPQYGFTGSVKLAVSGLPSGVTASISPNPVTGLAQLTLTATSTAALGTATLTVTGVSGTQTAKTTVSLQVVQPTFALNGPGPITLGAGSSVSPIVAVYPEYGFTGSVNLTISGLPSGVSASFAPNPTSGVSAITLTASATTAPGNYTATLTGTYGTTKATASFPLTVAAPSFTLSSYGAIQLGQGASNATPISVIPQNGFTGTVRLAASGLPSGVTATFTPDLVTGYSTLTLTASTTTTVGSSTITITGTSGTQTATTTISLQVAAPTFTLTSSGSMTIYPGQATAGYVSVNPLFGFTGSVKLAISGLPTGVTGSFSVNPTSQSTALNLSALSTATPGTSTVTIKGTWGTQTVTTTFSLSISAPSFTLYGPASMQLAPGSTSTGSISVFVAPGAPPLPAGVNLSVSGLPARSHRVPFAKPVYGFKYPDAHGGGLRHRGNHNFDGHGNLGKIDRIHDHTTADPSGRVHPLGSAEHYRRARRHGHQLRLHHSAVWLHRARQSCRHWACRPA